MEPVGLDTLLLVRRSEAPLPIPEGRAVVLEEDLDIELLHAPLKDGRNALLAFKNEEELLAWFPEGGPWVEFPAGDLIPRAFDNGFDVVLVSMSADCVYEITPEEFARMTGS